MKILQGDQNKTGNFNFKYFKFTEQYITTNVIFFIEDGQKGNLTNNYFNTSLFEFTIIFKNHIKSIFELFLKLFLNSFKIYAIRESSEFAI